MSASNRTELEQGDVFARLFASRDLPEALSLFFDAVLVPEGIDQAVVLIREGDTLRGALGMGVSDAVTTSVSVTADGADALARAYRGEDDAQRVAVPEEWASRSSEMFAVPLTGFRPGTDPIGLLLLASNGEAADVTPTFLQRVGSLAMVLSRIREREQLLRGQQQIEHQRDLLNSLVNALPDPVLITDSENSIVLENRRAESLFTTGEGASDGRRRAVEINNLLFSSFLTKTTISGTETSNSRELNLVDPSEGGDLLFEVLATPLPQEISGERLSVSVLRDVTDLKSAATELERQFQRVRQAEMKSSRERDRLNLILENVGDPILVTDDQSNIIMMNPEAERLFEIPTGTPLRSRLRQDVRANDTKFSSFISDFALSPDDNREAQFGLTVPETGTEFPAEVVSGKVMNERGEMTAIVSILHDLTKVAENERLAAELRQLNESLEDRIRSATLELEERNRQLEWQQQELERAYRLKSQFLASMSHELRTPINALLGYTSLMRDEIYGELNTRQDEALTRMYTASQHLLELVNDILDLAKIEAGKMPVHIEPVDVREIIQELSQTIEPMVRRRDLEYTLDLDTGLPKLRTDRTKVKQIVLNLLSNAVKFTHEGGVYVEMRSDEESEGVVIVVRDTGIGISEEDTSKIFEDFRQIDQSSTREYGGTGLGLSITKKLLHLLGGTIHVESKVGEGSEFTVWLPKESEEIVLDEEISSLAREANEAVVE